MKIIEVGTTPIDKMFQGPPRPYTPGRARSSGPNDTPPVTTGETVDPTEPSASPMTRAQGQQRCEISAEDGFTNLSDIKPGFR